MTAEDVLWQDGLNLHLPEEEPTDNACEYGRDFSQCLTNRLEPLDKTASQPEIAYKQWLLQESYHDFRSCLPRMHRDYTGRGHTCVYHVYLEYYAKLRLLALRLPVSNPFMSQVAQRSSRPAVPQQVAGIVIGEAE